MNMGYNRGFRFCMPAFYYSHNNEICQTAYEKWAGLFYLDVAWSSKGTTVGKCFLSLLSPGNGNQLFSKWAGDF